MPARRFACIILFFIVFVTTGLAQSDPKRYFTDTSCYMMAGPMQVIAGQQVVIQCDTAFVINKHRFRLYEKTRAYVLSKNPNEPGKAIEEYENALNKMAKYTDEISEKYKIISNQYSIDTQAYQAQLNLVSRELDKAKSELEKAKTDLAEAKKQISKKQNTSLKAALLYGATGLVAGLLIGLIIH
jgi:hypothetical protein